MLSHVNPKSTHEAASAPCRHLQAILHMAVIEASPSRSQNKSSQWFLSTGGLTNIHNTLHPPDDSQPSPPLWDAWI